MNHLKQLLEIKAVLAEKSNGLQLKETEVIELLGNEFPDINSDLEKLSATGNVYKIMQCFADFTKQFISKENYEEVKHCFEVAESMLSHGNAIVKNAIENSYLFSITTLIDFRGTSAEPVKKLLCASLRSEYRKQVLSCGI